MSNTLTVRAMKLRMVLKFKRPMLQEPSTSRMMSAFALVLQRASAETREDRSDNVQLKTSNKPADNSHISTDSRKISRVKEHRGDTADLQDVHTAQYVTETSAEQFSGNIWIKSSLLSPQIFTSSSSLLQVFTPPTSGEIYVHRITAHSCRSHLWVLKNVPPSCE